MIVIPQNTFYHSPGSHTPIKTAIMTTRYYWPPRISDVYIEENLVIMPYGYFYLMTPNDRIWGRNPYLYDLARTERLAGILVVDTMSGEVNKIALLGTRIGDYIIRAITSINIINKTMILLGCIAQYTRTRNLDRMQQTIIVELSTTNNWETWSSRIIRRVPLDYYFTRGYPIIPVTSNTYLSYSYLYIGGVEAPYHRTVTNPKEAIPLYAGKPLLAHNITWVDIDGDGEEEYTTILQYQRSSGTCWGSEPVCYMPPHVYGGGAWLLVFEHPVLYVKASGT